MEQHPIPRQITTFEFKLVGFMTLKQFIYLVVFFPLAYVIFSLFPVPILNILLAAATAGFGIVLAFVPVNDRPLDLYLKNLYKRLISPTQYYYRKMNDSIYFLNASPVQTSAATTAAHIDSKLKLSQYLSRKKKDEKEPQAVQKNILSSLLHTQKTPLEEPVSSQNQTPLEPSAKPTFTTEVEESPKSPFITGVVKTNKDTPLPGVLLYIKDQRDTPIRLLKTNPHGVFATYSSLPPGQYTVEIKDPKDHFSFDTMNISLGNVNPKPLEFYSKELM